MEQKIDFTDFDSDPDIEYEDHKLNTLLGIFFIVIWILSILLFQQN
jgi:hypothetical protein